MGDLLTVSDMSVSFGGVQAVRDVSFNVGLGESVGIAGPNGAGKSSLINAITGLARIGAGHVALTTEDRTIDLTARSAEARARLGLSRTFQHGGLLDELTALENVLCASPSGSQGGWASAIICSPGFLRKQRKVANAARTALAEIGLPDALVNMRVRDLAPADRQLVALARALIANPSVLFLDEVGAGTDPATKERIGTIVREFCRRPGRAVVFVEHDLAYLRRVADRLIFMAEGRVLAVGLPEDVLSQPDVLRAYIGDPELVDA